MVIMHKKKHRILIVRDETQGYYANDKWVYYSNKEKIHFEGCYEKENIARILKIAKREADSKLRSGYKMWVVYKYHLFGNVIEKWVKEIEPQALLFQPNSMIQNFYEEYLRKPGKDLLIIMGNEIGDILHEIFLYSLGLGKRTDSFNKTIFLSPKLKSLIEYQTVHGSADEIAGKNQVDPTATIRIAADIAENFLKCEGIILTVEKAIGNVRQNFLDLKQFDTLRFTEQVEDFIVKSSKKRW
jgi:isocitrate/isopropylmalate dehydrogenase